MIVWKEFMSKKKNRGTSGTLLTLQDPRFSTVFGISAIYQMQLPKFVSYQMQLINLRITKCSSNFFLILEND